MINLDSKGLNMFKKQETEVLEFFLNTSKPVVSIDYSVYMDNSYLIDESYSKFMHVFKSENSNKITTVAIAKTEEYLQEYINAYQSKTDYKFKKLGELFGYPETAINYFLTDNKKGKRYVVNYYGLKFVCNIKEIEQVESELLLMYGLPLISNKYSKKYA